MKKFFVFFLALLFFPLVQVPAHADEWCYEQDIIYPNGMFGQFSDRQKNSSKEVSKIFKFGKDKLPQRPHKMLYGLAYLEVLTNELCWERHNSTALEAREDIKEIVLDLRESLGLSKDMSHQKMINIYWSTGRLLSLANVEKLSLSAEKKENITILREAKAALKLALKDAKHDLE
jgi:hypothetical protein